MKLKTIDWSSYRCFFQCKPITLGKFGNFYTTIGNGGALVPSPSAGT